MSSWRGGDGFSSRSGLNARSHLLGSDQVQISIDPGTKFDLDHEVEGLRSHVGRIKQLAQHITEERIKTGEQINSLEEALERASILMKRARQRLNVAYRQAKSNHLLFLVLFVLVLFFVIYFLGKVYRVGKMLT